MLKDLAIFFKDLRDVVSEPVRSTIVCRFCRMFAAKLQEQEMKTRAKLWADRGQAQFIRDCNITNGIKAVSDDLDVTATELSRFCDHWLSVSQYRRASDQEWVPFSTDMNSIRVTMIEELQELAKKKLDNGSKYGSIVVEETNT